MLRTFLSYEIFYLQLGKVDIRGVEGEAHGETELGVHQQGHLKQENITRETFIRKW